MVALPNMQSKQTQTTCIVKGKIATHVVLCSVTAVQTVGLCTTAQQESGLSAACIEVTPVCSWYRQKLEVTCFVRWLQIRQTMPA